MYNECTTMMRSKRLVTIHGRLALRVLVCYLRTRIPYIGSVQRTTYCDGSEV